MASVPLSAWENETPVLDALIRETLRVAEPHVAMRQYLPLSPTSEKEGIAPSRGALGETDRLERLERLPAGGRLAVESAREGMSPFGAAGLDRARIRPAGLAKGGARRVGEAKDGK